MLGDAADTDEASPASQRLTSCCAVLLRIGRGLVPAGSTGVGTAAIADDSFKSITTISLGYLKIIP